ncbi:L-glutamate gamma-semialdehyde dehydrogenase [Micrococcales bacterium 31B]|nr:L-glutamate gamma-semialdehyde dehydrogenase [Micrococcales bacterium 31B]
MQAITAPPAPVNEPVLNYAPGSPERDALLTALGSFTAPVEIPARIGGRSVAPAGTAFTVTSPQRHARVLATSAHVTQEQTKEAIEAALAAAPAWAALSFDDRAAIFLRAATLLSGRFAQPGERNWRATLCAATMLGQGKTCFQAEIDAACELIDFLTFNVHFARQILAEQPPANSSGVWNRSEYRPLEGFVYAVTPFNFTAIGANLAAAPALMGNVVLWKPSNTQLLSAHLTMDLLHEAGLPDGVISLVPGDGLDVSEVALAHPALAGIHFTGSTATFKHLWRTVGENLDTYRTYPRLVGETGGKDFIVAHPSARADITLAALVRGAFEYSGQKCSAASRAYVPRSLWESGLRDSLAEAVASLVVGDPEDLKNFTGPVIDDRSFERNRAALDRARQADQVEVLVGGHCDDSVGYYVEPTVLVCADPEDDALTSEYFGPILAVHVYDDAAPEYARDPRAGFGRVLALVDSTSPYALTGALIADDPHAIEQATDALRQAAGNFYINDKCTGAVVGQQPFGGARASGTNDKAGSALNLLRWVSPRSIKTSLFPATAITYPHQG